MFERFTERARQVVVLAQDEARALKHNYIGTEHILLGLLREEEGLAARALASFDITVEEVRAQVARIVGPGDGVTTGQIPFTPRAKVLLELALREATSLTSGQSTCSWRSFGRTAGSRSESSVSSTQMPRRSATP
ncbi:MAG TPA: Clp protease N-terminal domain-containing protein [Gaiellaceae bacterium]|nr:Clp protease N-terminal domain-containing protein [Gaiellaceae bacterium]